MSKLGAPSASEARSNLVFVIAAVPSSRRLLLTNRRIGAIVTHESGKRNLRAPP
jgi:hypothetical protein